MDRSLVHAIEAISAKALTEALLDALRRTGTKIRDTTPVQDGHAHTAWRSAFNKVPGVSFPEYSGESNDPTAVRAGEAEYKLTGPQQHIKIINKLDFVRKMEYGLEITPIPDGGRKKNPVKRGGGVKGPLYGPRSDKGTGWLVWEDESGRTHRATSVTPTAGHYVESSLSRARDEIARARK